MPEDIMVIVDRYAAARAMNSIINAFIELDVRKLPREQVIGALALFKQAAAMLGAQAMPNDAAYDNLQRFIVALEQLYGKPEVDWSQYDVIIERMKVQ